MLTQQQHSRTTPDDREERYYKALNTAARFHVCILNIIQDSFSANLGFILDPCEYIASKIRGSKVFQCQRDALVLYPRRQ